DDRRHHDELDVPWIAAFRSRLLADFSEPLGGLSAGKTVEEQTFGVPGGKGAPALRTPGLKQNRGSLRRRLRHVHPAHTEVLAFMRDFVDAVATCVDAVRCVADDGIVLPAPLPELVDDLHILFGEVIARIMIELPIEAHGAGCAVLKAGYDIPTDTAFRQVIERREPSGKRIGRLVGQV